MANGIELNEHQMSCVSLILAAANRRKLATVLKMSKTLKTSLCFP